MAACAYRILIVCLKKTLVNLAVGLLPFVAGCSSEATSTRVAEEVVDKAVVDKAVVDKTVVDKTVVGKKVDDAGPIESAEVELSEPKGRITDQGIFYFEVKYRFTKGKPRQHYLVTVHFPGTKNLCLKHMEAWELKAEGLIKDGIPLVEQPVTAYEIVFSEADSPMNEYQAISNTAAGTLPKS